MTLRGPTHFYVWYVLDADAPDARMRVATLLRAVESAAGVAGRVLARRDDPTTWMEIYENVDDAAAFERMLNTLAERHGVTRLARNGRRVERFAALDDALSTARARR